MKKFAFVIYRSWAFEIFKNIHSWNKKNKKFLFPILITTDSAEFDLKDIPKDITSFIVDPKDNDKILEILSSQDITTAFFYGWSWIIKEPLLSNVLCLGLHPSLLPLYRGGTPLQHQINDGKTTSAFSLFIITKGVDAGDIYKQPDLLLKGDIPQIFKQMNIVGTKVTKQFIQDSINNDVKFHPQKNLEKHPPLRRRKLEENEIHFDNLIYTTYNTLYNLIRSLTGPYPRAYMYTQNKKLLFTKVKYSRTLPKNSTIITDPEKVKPLPKNICFKIKNGYMKIQKYTIENL